MFGDEAGVKVEIGSLNLDAHAQADEHFSHLMPAKAVGVVNQHAITG
jgi:hypothetical protein